MIDIIIGFLVVIPLIFLNDLMLLWGKKDPQKALGIVSVMFGMNLVILIVYGFLLRPDEPTNFILGLLAAILTVMIRKIKKLINETL
tara:strand:+ start:615 stop:875 length:261 start_codon:yes stop_codon:yes gene_type:complete